MRSFGPCVLAAALASCTKHGEVASAPSASVPRAVSMPPAASTPPGAAIQSDPMHAAEPDRVLRWSGGEVVISFRSASTTGRYVATVRTNDSSVFPPKCARSFGALPACGSDDAEGEYVRDAGDARVVTARATAHGVDVLFAMEIEGSPECGAYGVWLLRVDARGARTSNVIYGCFTTPIADDDPRGANPSIRWQPPVRIAPQRMDAKSRAYVLEEATFTWTRER